MHYSRGVEGLYSVGKNIHFTGDLSVGDGIPREVVVKVSSFQHIYMSQSSARKRECIVLLPTSPDTPPVASLFYWQRVQKEGDSTTKVRAPTFIYFLL